MAQLFKNLVVFSGLFFFSFVGLTAQGLNVYVFLKDGTQHYGELLSVRDSVIITSQEFLKSDDRIAEATEYINFSFFKDIDSVYLRSYEPKIYPAGSQIGSTVGGFAGFFADSEAGFGTKILYSLGGSLAGAIIGSGIDWAIVYMLSDSPEMLYPAAFGTLKGEARFDGEPNYVRDVFDDLLKKQGNK